MPSVVLLIASLTLVVAVHGRASGVPWLATAGTVLSLLSLVMCISPVALLAQLGFVIRHVSAAIATRACDVEIGGGSVRVLGGPSDGFHATLESLAGPGAVELTDANLVLAPAGGKKLSLVVPRDPDERASLEALAASLSAAAAGRAVPDRAPHPGAAALLRCAGCGVPLSPSAAASVRCALCGAETRTPADLARKVADAERLRGQRRRDEALCRALTAQPGPAMANLVAFAGGLLAMALAAVATFLSAVLAFPWDNADGPLPFRGLGFFGAGCALGLAAFVRGRLARRTALRVLTLGFSALPPSSGGGTQLPARCRNCGAPLPDAVRDQVLLQCAYCDAENLAAQGLEFDAAVVARFSAGEPSLAKALARTRRQRWLTRSYAVLGAIFVALGSYMQSN
jgi:LSD1 subclass zinc finger protein